MNALIEHRRQRDADLLAMLHQVAHDFQAAMTKHKVARPAITKAWQSLIRAQEAAEERLAARDLDEALDRLGAAGELAVTLLNAVDPEQDWYTAAPADEVVALAHRLVDVLFPEEAEDHD